LVLSGNTLYGTTDSGGSPDNGTLFAINTDGTDYTNLYSFTATSGPYPGTNSDGAYPWTGLVISGNTLYGTTTLGGASGNGTVFAVNTNGIGFATLYSFTAVDQTYYTNSDGANPYAGLLLLGNTLYATAEAGGSFVAGTVFSLTLGLVPVSPPQLTIFHSGANVILTC
jgi:uncharacterized repeat protein (TIGR03803 family)